MPELGKDWAHRAAATLAIDLMKEMPALDEGRAITIAWMSCKKMEIDGPEAKFDQSNTVKTLRSRARHSNRAQGAGRKRGCQRAARAGLGLA
jgi:hypothetical protein